MQAQPSTTTNPYLAHRAEPTVTANGPQVIRVLTQESIENADINLYNGRPFSQKYRDILKKRQDLPVFARREEFLEMLRKNQFIILVGETGSGKTTQYPLFYSFVKLIF